MGYSKRIDIRIGSTADLTGFAKVKAQLGGIGAAASKLGEAFGGANAYLGRFVQNLLKGSVWQMGAEAIGYVFKKTVEWAKSAEETARKTEEAITATLGACARGMDAYRNAVEEAAKAEREAANAGLKARQAEIDLTDRLAKATVELARQKRIAAGEDAKTVNAEADAAASEQSKKTARAKSDAEIRAIRRRIEIAENEAEDARDEERRIRDARAEMAEGGWAYYGSPKQEKAHLKALRAADSKAEEARQAGNRADERAIAERKALEDALARRGALEKELEAADIKAANERAAQVAEARRAAEVKAAQDAARERDRLDRELHQKRMADLRAEIAEQSKSAAPLKAAAAVAQGEFARAFAMYRDPARAAAAIGEEKSYAADLDRLHADAARYGGKWRIDELSRLMASGDAQGQADALASWRKSARFTPEVEAMVRASAAERAKTTAEDALRKIEQNTAGLAQKLDELVAMKGG